MHMINLLEFYISCDRAKMLKKENKGANFLVVTVIFKPVIAAQKQAAFFQICMVQCHLGFINPNTSDIFCCVYNF